MDPISIGISVGTALIAPLGKKLFEKATDPETVAKSLNWVFSAVDNFLRIRKKEKSEDTPIAPPPLPPSTATSTATSDTEIEQKVMLADEIVKSAKQSDKTDNSNGVKLAALDEFASEQLANEVISLMSQIETYLGNLNFEEEKAAQYGGVKFSPPIVMNTIRIQQEEVAKRIVRLNRCMQRAYGVSAPNLERLVEASQAS